MRERDFEVFLQGSYKNDTNIYGESDVDVVVQLNQTFERDLSGLPSGQVAAYKTTYSSANYHLPQFRSEVLQTLRNRFGPSISEGGKSIKLSRESGRLPADIVVCTQYRKYTRFVSIDDQSYVEGIVFYAQGGRRVISFPNPHYKNGLAKNSRTNGLFKPSVRMFKNARNSLVSNGAIRGDTAPSYFLECLIYNVPDGKFGGSFRETYCNIVNWLNASDLTALVCQNGQLPLFGDAHEQWSVQRAKQFSTALIQLWTNS